MAISKQWEKVNSSKRGTRKSRWRTTAAAVEAAATPQHQIIRICH
jgi:hypothetical protein